MLAGDLDRGPNEGGFADRRLVERNAERVDVALGGHPLALELLRGGVERGAEVCTGPGGVRGGVVQGSCDTEVGELGFAISVDEDVVGLHVAVDHAALVSVGEPCRRTRTEVSEVFLGEGPFLVDHTLQVASGYVLHDDVRDLSAVEFGLSRIVDLDYVGVGEPGGGASLAPEARAYISLVVSGVEDLDRDRAV